MKLTFLLLLRKEVLLVFLFLTVLQELRNVVGEAIRGRGMHRHLQGNSCIRGQCSMDENWVYIYSTAYFCSEIYYPSTQCVSNNVAGFPRYDCMYNSLNHCVVSSNPCAYFNTNECSYYSGYGCFWTCTESSPIPAPTAPAFSPPSAPAYNYGGANTPTNDGGGEWFGLSKAYWIVGLVALFLVVPAVWLARKKINSEDRPMKCLLTFLGAYFGAGVTSAATGTSI